MGPSLAEMHELNRRMESLAKEFGFDGALLVVSKGHEMRILEGKRTIAAVAEIAN